jgi:hypothetical protein
MEPLRFSQPFLATALFSTRAGLFPWTPVAYLAVAGAGLALLTRRDARHQSFRELVGGLCLVFALDLYVVSCAWLLHSGFTFGSRRLTDAAPLIGLAAAYLVRRLRSGIWQKVLLTFVAFCLVFNGVLVELLRQRKIHGSGAEARSLAAVLESDLQAPAWMVRTAEDVGYLFVQPAGWIFAAWHHMKPAAYESVAGNFLLDRDGQWLRIMNQSLPLDRSHRWYVASGMVWRDDKAAEVIGPVRMLFPLFAKEAVEVLAVGKLVNGPIEVQCNGIHVNDVAQRSDGARFKLPESAVSAGMNELFLKLPVGTRIERLQVSPSTEAPR